MGAYRHILVAVDFGAGHEQVIERAKTLALTENARLSLIHVVEYLHMDLANELVLPQDIELEAQLAATARRKLEELAAGIVSAPAGAPVNQWVEMGSTKLEILRVAQEQGADLIVIGSHGRHGLGRLLGSTANAVLHGAPCDVLAVRIREA
ncbi:MAG TPA: universal stress protein [Gammaproteobacteria bacterium]